MSILTAGSLGVAYYMLPEWESNFAFFEMAEDDAIFAEAYLRK
jgi:hypothetical protein